MTNEAKVKFKVKARKIWNAAKELVVPLFVGGTVGAAWGGYIAAFRHNKDIAELKANLRETDRVINHNADVQRHDREVLSELQRQQNLLFERALKETEGEKAE